MSTPVRTTETVRSVNVSPAGGTPTGTPPVKDSGKTLPHDVQQLAADSGKLDQVVKHLNDYAQTINREVQFSIDKDSGRTLVKVVDLKTKEVIRQMPSEEVLRLDRYLSRGDGLVFHAKA